MSRAGMMFAADAHGDLVDYAFKDDLKRGRIQPQKGAVKAVTKVVKTVASTATSFLKDTGLAGIGDFLGPIGYVMSAYSFLEQRRLGKKQETAETRRVAETNKLEEQKQKIAEANIQKQRRALMRESYLKRSNIIANLAQSGVAFPGTSIASGATGSLLTQEALQQANLTGVEMAGREMSQTAQNIGSYASQVATTGMQMQGYQNLATLGINIGRDFKIGNPFEVPKTESRSFSSDYFDTFNVG
jgi:rhamnose utilization protein RhaD (predicted bifunctional aldolase and dehydrogenase)